MLCKWHMSREKDLSIAVLEQGLPGLLPLYPDHFHDLNPTMCSLLNSPRRFAIATVAECATASLVSL